MKKTKFLLCFLSLLILTACSSGISKEREKELLQQIQEKTSEIVSLNNRINELEDNVNKINQSKKYILSHDYTLHKIHLISPVQDNNGVSQSETRILVLYPDSAPGGMIEERIFLLENSVYEQLNFELVEGVEYTFDIILIKTVSLPKHFGIIKDIHQKQI